MPCSFFGSRDARGSAKLRMMESRISRVVATLSLLACVICPVLEMFDRWDHTVQTGQDTEYTLVLLALCFGIAYALARFAPKFSFPDLCKKLASTLRPCKSLVSCGGDCLFVFHTDGSPPPLALRI